MNKQTEIPDWETLLAHAALLQSKIPAAILVGGTAAAVHAGHRISFDHDRVKIFLVVDRNATRDYLDVAALSHYIGLKKSAAALESMNELYAEFKDEAGDLLTSVSSSYPCPIPTILPTSICPNTKASLHRGITGVPFRRNAPLSPQP